MLKIRSVETLFPVPQVVFTLKGNPMSESIVLELQRLKDRGETVVFQEHWIFETSWAVKEYFDRGVSSQAAVVLFDEKGSRCLRMKGRRRMDALPSWACGAAWGVEVHNAGRPDSLALQIRATFVRQFEERLARQWFPWGQPRKHDMPPTQVVLPQSIEEVIKQLNQGPDLASTIAHTKYALELPKGTKISWIRVAPEPITVDEAAS